MSSKKDLVYDSETGDVMAPEMEGVPAFEPLRVPGIVEQFMKQYVPAPDEKSATDVFSMGRLRETLCCFVAFNSRSDVLSDYLDVLANEGYIMQDTTSGPALCVISTGSERVIDIYDEAEEV